MALPQDRGEMITNFREVCAVDEDRALQFLAHCDFNLERAVQLFFQTGGVLDNTNEGTENERNWENELRRRTGRGSSNGGSADNTHNGIARNNTGVVAGREMSWIEWFIAVATLPVSMLLTTFSDIWNTLLQMFTGPNLLEVTDPKGDVTKFVRNYIENIAAEVESPIDFIDDSFNEVCKRARRDIRVLLVYIGDERLQSVQFLKESLSTALVKDILQSHGVYVWGASVSTPEGKRVAHQLRIRSYPHLCLMVPRESRLVSSIRLGPMAREQLANNISIGLNMVEVHLRQLRAQLLRREEDTRIRAEQEKEYKEALIADRKKKEEKERREEEKREREEEEGRRERERDRLERVFQEKRDYLKKSASTCAVEGESIRVQLRFPCGARAERKFRLDDSLENVFNLALMHDSCPRLFSLFTNFPRRSLSAWPLWYLEWRNEAHSDSSIPPSDSLSHQTFRQHGLSQSLVVMVQDDAA